MADDRRSNHGLTKYIDRIVQEVRSKLSTVVKHGDVNAIHDVRVGTRRLKSAVGLLEGQFSKRLADRFQKALKSLRRRLGPLRDIDIMSERLRKLSSRDDTAVRFLLAHLDQERQEALKNVQNINASKILARLGSWWGLREQMKEELARSRLLVLLREQSVQFCQQADTFVLASKMEPQTEKSKQINPHDLRIAGKALRYVLEIAKVEGLQMDVSVIRKFKKIQDLLGLWHDYVVLTEKILSISIKQDVASQDALLEKQLLKIALNMAGRSHAALKRFAREWLELGPELLQRIEAGLDPTGVVDIKPVVLTAAVETASA